MRLQKKPHYFFKKLKTRTYPHILNKVLQLNNNYYKNLYHYHLNDHDHH